MTDTTDILYKLLYAIPEPWTDETVLWSIPIRYKSSGYTIYYQLHELVT